MGLISEEVEIKIGNNLAHYENLGYIIPKIKNINGKMSVKRGTNIIVKTSDLSKGCEQNVEVQCDSCNKILSVPWISYLRYVHEGGKYYCINCGKNCMVEKIQD